MMYVYLGRHSVKVIGLTKTLLGQFNIAHFAKTHASSFVTNGVLQGTDLIASAIKEAVTNAQPEPITDKDVCLVLPQELFAFGRYAVPSDISESAIVPFIQDKVRGDLQVSLEGSYHDYMLSKRDGEAHILFYALPKDVHDALKQALSLVQLKLVRIVPETVSYYTLFEKTLRQDKKENILYAAYKDVDSAAYLYDSHGLLKSPRYDLGADVKADLKQLVETCEQEGHKINRLILSGTQSKSVRQDLFTKEVGAWTNPLEKIIENFYKDYLRMLVPTGGEGLSVLEHDACFGAYIFTEEHKDFTLMGQTVASGPKSVSMPKVSMNMGWLGEIFNLKTMAIFAISFIVSFGIIFAGSRMQSGGFGSMNIGLPAMLFDWKLPSFGGSDEEKKTTPTPEPTAEPTPTPSVSREDLQVKVLNGSGIAGKAGEVQEILQEAGYTDIVTANADSFDYTTTEVQLSADAEDALTYIQEDLADYVTITDAATIEDEEETADVIIIVGTDFE